MASRHKEKLFSEYPDVVTVKQMCSMLGGISMKTAYRLLEDGTIRYLKIGKSFKIPKVYIIEYLVGEF
ncbi:helix-turn-helix domain-containing protein [Dysosmobacter sp.]|uniref:helix-turn-helix domain-containing protein n=1 Tax=Dysosmobacter sp. TaxID=2591382 RepID=UPI002A9E6911|nr:helix-turn-helix domain-containing protein [Dysosmobacter sp.]MDY5510276.1 helix-turn-helix domain-containing protein [Dysosmobacter sp.]